jgi:terminal uridylyltransferase
MNDVKMFPSSNNPQQGGDLESRLRGLILNNAHPNTISVAEMQTSISASVPPHMITASPAEQQQYLMNRAHQLPQSNLAGNILGARAEVSQEYNTPVKPQHEPKGVSDVPDPSPQPARKRLNQAQRRQMSSQLSIPVDLRPQQSSQSGRGYTPSPGSTQQGWGSPGFNNQYGQRNPPQPQRAPRFPNQGPTAHYSPRDPQTQGHQQTAINQSQPGPNLGFWRDQPTHGPNPVRQQYAGNRGDPGASYGRPSPQNRQLYQPGPYGRGQGRQFIPNPEEIANQSAHLVKLLQDRVPTVGIDSSEEADKEAFRAVIELACRDAISQFEQEELGNTKFDPASVELKCFGSMSSGFATRASDMDLALLTPLSKPPADTPESPIPRLLERKLLDLGYGARLLTRTRVPIIKLCQKPTQKLMSGLLEARAKWEDGFVEGLEEEEEEVADAEVEIGAECKASDSSEPTQNSKETRAEGSKPSPIKLPSSDLPLPRSVPHERQLAKLKQKENQSLADYYNSAKRLLRQVGGRDFSHGSPSLSAEESDLLNDVCRAFISGLSSETLATRLRCYKSISPLFDLSPSPIFRSLNGVWAQVEGERLAMAFENRPLTEANTRREEECALLMAEWSLLQNKISGPVVLDPMVYNRELYVTAEKLKSFSSVQLVLLEQMQHEEPIYYQRRAQKILDDLKGNQESTSDTATPIVVSHYVAGIRNHQIREKIQNSSGYHTLNDVAIQHRMLQLAVDYEHALKKNMYEDKDRPTVEQYITFLRGSITEQKIEPALLANLRTLPDPTAISPNKPRDRYRDHLEFPKTDIGIQCDINFSANLALHNTLLLRCYSHSDPRVKQIILFIKHWAKVRGINVPYRGSLSSYGYVLMVLHYLVNIAQPFVCPNLQHLRRDPPAYLPPAEIEAQTTCQGRDVRFWRNETEIKALSAQGSLNHNNDSVGVLLRGFFEYFAQGGQMSTVQGRGFDWGREVLSLRSPGGIISKQEKGWTGAKTTYETTTVAAPLTPAHHLESGEGESPPALEGEEPKPTKHHVKTVEETKEIRHRYLFAIEDPFELDHNVARTVTHNGIVSIRDEFRRAWRLIRGFGKPYQTEEGLLDPVVSTENSGLQELLDLIHGVQQDKEGQV